MLKKKSLNTDLPFKRLKVRKRTIDYLSKKFKLKWKTKLSTAEWSSWNTKETHLYLKDKTEHILVTLVQIILYVDDK